ncbi:MAG: hypothetical protein IPK79_03170 [Vampirovibrionales bacterium]|nr:hypothetical protein [Vampirovibrionales bacterium]
MRNALTAIALSLAVGLCPALTPMVRADGNLPLRPLANTGAYSYSATPYQAANYNYGGAGAAATTAYSASGYSASGYSASSPLRGRVSTLPKGSTMIIKLDQPLSSFSSNLGESITGTLENNVFVNDAMAIPAGSEVLGQVSNVSRAGRLGKHGEVDVRFFNVKTPDGAVIPIQGHVVTKDNTGTLRGNTFTMDVIKGVGVAAGGTAIGAVAGTAVGGLLGVAGTGAAMGTGVGALAGIGYAVVRRGKDVVIPSGSRLSIKVDEDVSLNY